ncbi:hypothetical protein BUALT_Bualt10G0058200 [Buddleja alternifolia]|uniref:Uncharacterized protein n=1 Tax=Buddleja alternifolia TaxID=168488 RepID=A0AAV6WY45_9LAMI|nr:hypothetical protein BUALT_Bualt10G0058200 [Buddleja alternifolia]
MLCPDVDKERFYYFDLVDMYKNFNTEFEDGAEVSISESDVNEDGVQAGVSGGVYCNVSEGVKYGVGEGVVGVNKGVQAGQSKGAEKDPTYEYNKGVHPDGWCSDVDNEDELQFLRGSDDDNEMDIGLQEEKGEHLLVIGKRDWLKQWESWLQEILQLRHVPIGWYLCCNAHVCIAQMRFEIEDYADPYFKKDTYFRVCRHMINPVPGMNDHEESTLRVVDPQIVVPRTGRPRKMPPQPAQPRTRQPSWRPTETCTSTQMPPQPRTRKQTASGLKRYTSSHNRGAIQTTQGSSVGGQSPNQTSPHLSIVEIPQQVLRQSPRSRKQANPASLSSMKLQKMKHVLNPTPNPAFKKPSTTSSILKAISASYRPKGTSGSSSSSMPTTTSSSMLRGFFASSKPTPANSEAAGPSPKM